MPISFLPNQLLDFKSIQANDGSLNAGTENFFQKHLKTYLIAVFITTAMGSFLMYLRHDSWTIGDWLINYQGGMVRRGLPGELIHQLSYITNVNPGIYVVALQVLLYSIFFFSSYALLRAQRFLLPYSILIASPFIFTFQINSARGGFRKEILYLALLAFITWVANTKDSKYFEKIVYLALLAYPAIILSHEMLAIFLPYLVAVYILVIPVNKKKLLILTLLLLPSVCSFAAAMYFSGNEFQTAEIHNSIAKQNYLLNEDGAIHWLSKDASFGIGAVADHLGDFGFYLLNLALALIAYIPLHKKLLSILKNKLALLLLATSLIGTVAVLFVALDWGRFLYIHLVSMFFLLLLPSTDNIPYFWFPNTISKRNLMVFFCLYALFWSIPHYDRVLKKTFQQPNFVAFFLPYISVVKYYPRTFVLKELAPAENTSPSTVSP